MNSVNSVNSENRVNSVQAVYSAVLPPIGAVSVCFTQSNPVFLVKILAVFFSMEIFVVVLSSILFCLKMNKHLFCSIYQVCFFSEGGQRRGEAPGKAIRERGACASNPGRNGGFPH